MLSQVAAISWTKDRQTTAAETMRVVAETGSDVVVMREMRQQVDLLAFLLRWCRCAISSSELVDCCFLPLLLPCGALQTGLLMDPVYFRGPPPREDAIDVDRLIVTAG